MPIFRGKKWYCHYCIWKPEVCFKLHSLSNNIFNFVLSVMRQVSVSVKFVNVVECTHFGGKKNKWLFLLLGTVWKSTGPLGWTFSHKTYELKDALKCSQCSCAHHFLGLLPVDHAEDVADDLTNVVVGNLAGPACADTFGPVDKHRGNDGDVPLWLNTLVVIKVVFK